MRLNLFQSAPYSHLTDIGRHFFNYQIKPSLHLKDRRGCTALCHACTSGNTEGALLLINTGATILNPDANGDIPEHKGVRSSHTVIVKVM